jgi:hypothetical protein
MKTSDITIVFQGAFKAYKQVGSPSFAEMVKFTRKVLPGATVILSTWEGAEIPDKLGVDDIVFCKDPGALAPLKLTDDKLNNINRQIATTYAGMQRVKTPYAVKLRTDCFLEHASFIDFYETQVKRDGRVNRIVTGAFFTLDIRVFERIPYHVSDWFQFGLTEVLQSYWDVPFMTAVAGKYYETHEHAPGSNLFERRFRAQFAVEQYICMQYAESIGYRAPARLNDVSPAVLEDAQRFLATEILVLDPWQCGLVFPKYGWVNASVLQRINNVMHLDWLALARQPAFDDSEPATLEQAIASRKRLKQISQWLFEISAPAHKLLFEQSGRGRFVRRVAMKVFRIFRVIKRA